MALSTALFRSDAPCKDAETKRLQSALPTGVSEVVACACCASRLVATPKPRSRGQCAVIEYAENSIAGAEESMSRSDSCLILIGLRTPSATRDASFVAEQTIRELILRRMVKLYEVRARALLLDSSDPLSVAKRQV